MKKMFFMSMLLMFSIVAFGCKSSEFRVDGEFLAYNVSVQNDAPMVTFVSVTITDGEISDFTLDAKQGSRTATQLTGTDTPDDETDDTFEYSFAWNEKTKVELGDDYNMVAWGGATNEWYAQAKLIEDHWLENGVDSIITNDGDVVDNVAGVTIKDVVYSTLAQEAVENAKEGKFTAIHTAQDDLLFAVMIVDGRGRVDQLLIDVLQGNPSGDTFAWRNKTKQELGADYGMVSMGGATLEWFKQANLISNYIVENGWHTDLQSIDGKGISLDGQNAIDSLSGVTVRTGNYLDLLEILFGYVH